MDSSAPEPALFLARLLDDARRYGMPATRKPAPLWTALAALPPSAPVSAPLFRRWPRRVERADVDRLRTSLLDAWPDLSARDPSLPSPSALSALVLERSSSTTVFFFDRTDEPVLVAKWTRGDDLPLATEAAALEEAEAAGIAPIFLGRVEGAFVQSGAKGRPYRLEAVTAADATSLAWREPHERVAEGLVALARTTSKEGVCSEATDGVVEAALASGDLPDRMRDVSMHALEEVASAARSILKHGDVNAQNALLDESGSVVLVDWAGARSKGLPGADVLNLALSDMEHSLALRSRGSRDVLGAFIASWRNSTLWREARARCRNICEEAELAIDPRNVEILFFARRFAHRHAAGADTHVAFGMLGAVCEH